jgi:hypothetical protein
MSQENVEQLRAGIESFLAGTSESAREAMLRRSAEGWDPEVELDASEWREKMEVWWCAFGSEAEALKAVGLAE